MRPARTTETIEVTGRIIGLVEECPVGELLKAGGGCRCLTLAPDVRLSGR